MNRTVAISPDYRKPVLTAVATQAILLLVSGSILDGGVTFRICAMAGLAFWGGVTLMVCRRPRSPTKADLNLISLGSMPLVAMAHGLVPWIWHLRGVW